MTNRNIPVFLFLLAILVFSFTGCGGGGTDDGANLTPGTATVFGLAVMNIDSVEGAAVSVVSDGFTVPLGEASTTDHGGAFAAELSPYLPSGPFTVVVTAPNGDVFETEVDGIANGSTTFVHINGLTTLCRAYHVKHPEMSIEEVRDKIHRYVGIPEKYDLGDNVAHPHYSKFSLPVFMKHAREYTGGLTAYFESVATEIDSSTISLTGGEFGSVNNLANFADAIVPEWEAGVERMASPTTAVGEAVSETFNLSNTIGDGLIDNIIHLIIDHIPGLGSAPDLSDIESQLTEVQTQIKQMVTMIETLAQSLEQEFNQSEYTDISTGMPTENIIGAYNQIQQIQIDSTPASSPNLTRLPTDVQALYTNANWVNTQIDDDANTIHAMQSVGTPGNQPLLYYAKQLTYVDNFIGNTNWNVLQQQMNYYAGLQVQAINLLGAINSPSSYNIIGQNSPGGLRLEASDWISRISGNVQQEMMQLPLPTLTQNEFAAFTKNALLFQNASVSMATGANAWDYAANLTDGGLNWVIADTPTIQAVFNAIKGISGGAQDNFSEWMNTNLGTNLKPGKVTYYPYEYNLIGQFAPLKQVTTTKNGFLTLTRTGSSGSCYNYTVGWIDDSGKTGNIGTFTACDNDRVVMALNNAYPFVALSQKNIVGWACQINGPCIIMNGTAFNPTAPTNQDHGAVVMGAYDGLKISSSAIVTDPYSNGSSGTEPLTVYPTRTGNELSFELTNYAYWTSSDPQNAPISNVQSSDGSASAAGSTFPPLPNNAGTIHWLPGSVGESVTFTATRQLPNGTDVQGTITLKSPVKSSAPAPQAVSVWPSSYNVIASNWNSFKQNGLQLYPTRFYGSGNCEDARSNVTYALPQDAAGFTVSSQGFLQTSLGSLPQAGTSLVVTVTDPLVPAQTSDGNVRPTATCTITFN